MQTNNQVSLMRKALYWIMLFGLFLSAFGAESLPSVRALEAENETSIIQPPENPKSLSIPPAPLPTASEPTKRPPKDAQSTTGPIPPPEAVEMSSLEYTGGTGAVVISGVPTYLWRHGCGPTAAGMMIGYWDSKPGYEWLISGSASTQTTAVNEVIASTTGVQNHYTDYALPDDGASPTILPDKSELPVGDEHADNSIADFMHTSQSYSGNKYGWSWFSDFGPALVEDIQMSNNPGGFTGYSTNLYYDSTLWNTFKAEIDAGRPVGLLVDSSGDGTSDHFIPAFGYDESSGVKKYAAYNTWDYSLHWYDFGPMTNGKPWGILGAITLDIKETRVISGNAGVAGATLSYIDGSTLKTATADENGLYSFVVPKGWSGTVTPSKAAYTFTPDIKSYTNVTINETQNYIATATGETNLLQDASFEAYSPNPYWREAAINFNTPLCTVADCGSAGTYGPRTGSAWSWFGLIGDTPKYELSSLSQTVNIPYGTATLEFYLWISGATGAGSDATDTFTVKIDGVPVFSAHANQMSSYPSYTLVSINVSAYANGASHEIKFLSETTGQSVSFNLDDVALLSAPPKPHFDVFFKDGVIDAYDWPLGTLLTMNIEDPNTVSSPDYSTTANAVVASWDPNQTLGEFKLNGAYTITPGMTITVSGASKTKELVVSNLSVTSIDLEHDIITGSTDPNQNMWMWYESSCCRGFQANSSGTWTVDYSQIGPNDEPIADIKLGSNGTVNALDNDGDNTSLSWRVPNPLIHARPIEEAVEGEEWPLGATVNLTIDNPATQTNPDYTASTTVVVADWDPKQTYFRINLNNYDLKIGDILTVTDGNVTKQHTTKFLEFTSININTDIVYGKASPGQVVNIWTCWQNVCINRDEITNQNGQWATNFAVPGEKGWEKQTADIRYGSWIDSEVNDEDGDSTRFGWEIPTEATNLSPNTNITTNYNPTYQWNKVLSATYYHLYVTGSSGVVVDQWYESSSICDASVCSVTPGPSATLGGGSYSWYVQTYNAAGYGPWSNNTQPTNFTTTIPSAPAAATSLSPGTVNPATPADIGTNYTPMYSWDKITGATYYHLYVSGPSGVVLDQWYPSASICPMAVCSVASPTLGGGTYSWYVQTYNSVGYGPWSNTSGSVIQPVRFTTSSTPPAAATSLSPGTVNPATPTDIGTNYTPTYSWDKITGATWYHLYVSGPSGVVLDQWYQASSICPSTCSVTSPLLGGGTYSWYVQTYGPAGYGPWSNTVGSVIQPVRFTTSSTPPAAATSLSPGTVNPATPTDIGTNYTPTYSWDKITGATWYRLYVSGPSGVALDQWYQAEVICPSTCSVTSPTLGGGTYSWYVQTYGPAGYGPWSNTSGSVIQPVRFTTSSTPPLAATSLSPGTVNPATPTDIGTNYTPMYSWDKIAGATWYRLYVSGPSGVALDQWYQASSICPSTCSVTSPLLGGGTYSWYVQTYGPGGYGPWSNTSGSVIQPVRFSTTTTLSAATSLSPGTVNPATPTDIGTNYTPTYSWDKITGATWYRLYVSGPSGVVLDQWYQASSICPSTCSVTSPLLGGGTYSWYVQTYGPAGYGPWSNTSGSVIQPVRFTTATPAIPAGATLTLPTPGTTTASHTPTYTWTKVDMATWYHLYVKGPGGVVVKDQWYQASSVCVGATCTVVSPTLESGFHTWWIQTYNAAGYGPWKSATFTVSP
jgi:hypothetical protein